MSCSFFGRSAWAIVSPSLIAIDRCPGDPSTVTSKPAWFAFSVVVLSVYFEYTYSLRNWKYFEYIRIDILARNLFTVIKRRQSKNRFELLMWDMNFKAYPNPGLWIKCPSTRSPKSFSNLSLVGTGVFELPERYKVSALTWVARKAIKSVDKNWKRIMTAGLRCISRNIID